MLPAAGKPVKTVLNLTTAVDSLAFNHDSQMLVMASRLKRDALRCALPPLRPRVAVLFVTSRLCLPNVVADVNLMDALL